jgi:lipopolysaccharide/colanic/teichoic acid biosynthesis glycosyltransferase
MRSDNEVAADSAQSLTHGAQASSSRRWRLPIDHLFRLFQRTHNDIGDTVAIELQRAALSPREQAIKRGIDIVLSWIGLIILLPILLAAAIAIRLDSPGPVLFRQTRYGFDGRPFRIYKFRTMSVMENGDVVPQAQRGDKRVTRVGRWLRRYSIDELPQLINVLIGDMSLVGPRPHVSAHERLFTSVIEKYAFRPHIRSGMTGWAQVHGAHGETDTLDKMQRRVELDIWYINNWSVWLDFSIVIMDILVILNGENIVTLTGENTRETSRGKRELHERYIEVDRTPKFNPLLSIFSGNINRVRTTLQILFYFGAVVVITSAGVWLACFWHENILLQVISSGIMFFASVLCVFSLLSGETPAEEVGSDGR